MWARERGRRGKGRGCCRKKEQIIYKVLKWRGEYSVIRRQKSEAWRAGGQALGRELAR